MHTLALAIAGVLGVIGGLVVVMGLLGAAGLGPEDSEAKAFREFERDRDLR